MSFEVKEALQAVNLLAKIGFKIFQEVSENDDFCKRILQHLNELKNNAEGLQLFERDEWPESCKDKVANFEDSLEICKSMCVTLKNKSTIKNFFTTGSDKTELQSLEKELQRASSRLQNLLQLISMVEIKSLKEAVRRGTQEVKAATFNPKDGVFAPNSKSVGVRPHKIENLQVAPDKHGDLMELNWSDDKNPEGTVNSYDIRYDDENEQVLSMTVKECRVDAGSNKFSIRIGPPKIKPGHLYTVTVRGINGAGPGEWSKEQVFRFKTAPNKPKQPTVTVLSPTEVLITTKRPPERDENGSTITHCKVEYTKKMDGNDLTWDNLKNSIKQRPDVKLKIRDLTPDTTYNFRIKMINEIGESAPSDSVSINTIFIPGPPQGLRISSRRRDKSIKLRWEEPAINPQAAHRYKVQICLKDSDWILHSTVNKNSAKITSLKTSTKYCFRVQTINNKGEGGEWSEPVEAEIRYNLFDHAAKVGGGVIDGVADAGGTVAGILTVGVVVPLLLPLAVAEAIYTRVYDTSPQTSDDEDDCNVQK